MVFEQERHAVGRFSAHLDAEHTLSQLHQGEFIEPHFSILTNRDRGQQPNFADLNEYPQEHTAKEIIAGACAGGMLGTLFGCFAGVGVLTVPGVGFLLVAVGATGAYLVTALTGAGIGAISGSLIASALVSSERVSQQAPIEK